jgi:hypothetical protein
MRPEFLKTGLDNLGQVAALVLFGNADGFFDLAFLQTAGNRGSEFPGLLASLAESNVTIDHDADGPGRHDGQQNNDGSGGETHAGPHRTQIKADFVLEQHNGEKVELNKKHKSESS